LFVCLRRKSKPITKPLFFPQEIALFHQKSRLPAINGREGLELILTEKPAVAVVDYILPLLTGIEICREIRSRPEHADTRLLLFTADERDEVQKQAMEAGADLVIRKGPEASELIEAVQQAIRSRSAQGA